MNMSRQDCHWFENQLPSSLEAAFAVEASVLLASEGQRQQHMGI